MNSIGGLELFGAFAAGRDRLLLERSRLDAINVFPVPDGDTGSNMAATLSGAIENAVPNEALGSTLASIGDAAIEGARGNSGIILAQYLSGLAEGLSGFLRAEARDFAAASLRAYERAKSAIAGPREGTILTLMREWAHALHEGLESTSSFAHLFPRSLPRLEGALARTREELEVLREAGVVDAGARGFYAFMAGIAEAMAKGDFAAAGRHLDLPLPAPRREEEAQAGREPELRYCTETLVVGEALDPEALRGRLADLGDSLIVAGGGRKARIHIHTDAPAEVMARALAFGNPTRQKVDDMLLQYRAVHGERRKIALVTDSSCDLPPELLLRHDIHVVPLGLRLGGVEYLDRRTIDAEGLRRGAASKGAFPTTFQPPPELFSRCFRFLAAHHESIIAIHLSGKMSGTFEGSAREAAKLEGARISVVDSRHLSGSLGLIVLRAAEAREAGASHEEILASLGAWSEKARILVSVRSLDYMVRGGRVSPLKGALAKLLNLKPIVSVDGEGRSTLHGQALSVGANERKIIEMVLARHREAPLRSWALVHAGAEEAARALGGRIEAAIGIPALYCTEISAVVALNAGPGAVSVVTMSE